MEWNVTETVNELDPDFKAVGTQKKVKGISSLEDATSKDLAFCSWEGEKGSIAISNSNAGVILCKKSLEGAVSPKSGNQLIFVNNPKLVFINFISKNFQKSNLSGISPTSKISDKSIIGKNCYIGDYVVIGDNCHVGDNSIIFGSVNIIENCTIGKNCIIQSGCVIGSDGYSYERNNDKTLVRFPNFKGVKIGDNVEICCNCSIAKGSLSETIIEDGTKIDALVHIAHNVKIGKNCQLAAGTIIGGSTKIGDNCWLGLNSTILDRISIGNNVIVGAGSTVINNVNDLSVVAGVPAKQIKHNLSSLDLFKMRASAK